MQHDEQAAGSGLTRISSGIPGLDTLTGGGFFAHGAYLIAGIPGTGKTTLGHQLAFTEAARGGSAIFATILAESHGRMIAHMRQFSFFDPAQVGQRIHYVNLFAALEDGGLDDMLTEIRRLVRSHHASLLIIDGTTAAEDLAPSGIAYRRFTQEIQIQSTLLGCTTFLLSNRRSDEVDEIATHVDGVLVLSRERIDGTATRWAEVVKLRGADHLMGGHHLAITRDGIVIYPRPEAALSAVEPGELRVDQRMPFGIPGLDHMLTGGLPACSSTAVLGPPGTAKTTMCLHFAAEGAARGEPVVIAAFRETPKAIIDTAAGLGLDLATPVEQGLVRILWQPPLELSPDQWVWNLLATVKQHGARRVVIDAMSDIVQLLPSPDRGYSFTVAMNNGLRAEGATSLFTIELPTVVAPDLVIPLPAASAAIDNAFVLRNVELDSRLRRLVSILKLRQSGFDTSIREFDITSNGVVIGDVFRTTTGLLTGEVVPAKTSRHPRAAGAT